MKENWSKVVCGRPVTVALILMYQAAAFVEGPEIGRGSSEISISPRLRF